MLDLHPDYLAELARQLAFISAVLGGFAATFFGTLLAATATSRTANWATGSAGVAAVCFVCSAVVTAFIATGLHPSAPPALGVVAGGGVPRALGGLCLIAGVYALLVSVALGGWLRSRAVGVTTTSASVLGAVLVTWAFLGF